MGLGWIPQPRATSVAVPGQVRPVFAPGPKWSTADSLAPKLGQTIAKAKKNANLTLNRNEARPDPDLDVFSTANTSNEQ